MIYCSEIFVARSMPLLTPTTSFTTCGTPDVFTSTTIVKNGLMAILGDQVNYMIIIEQNLELCHPNMVCIFIDIFQCYTV